MVVAFGLALRIFSQDRGFLQVVNESLATTEGYDQKFIDLVNHLEVVMTTRASFSFPGGKDPMTGRRREVANISGLNVASARIAASKTLSAKNAKPAQGDKNSSAPTTAADSAALAAAEHVEDNVKLTALIADDYGQHTAIVMNGERSQSVDVGDLVGKRKVTKITSKEITMEDDVAVYSYDISGNRDYQKK